MKARIPEGGTGSVDTMGSTKRGRVIATFAKLGDVLGLSFV